MQLNLHALVLASLALLAAAAPVAVPAPDTPVLTRPLLDISDNTVAVPVDVLSNGDTQDGHANSIIDKIARRKVIAARASRSVDVHNNGNTQVGDGISTIGRRKDVVSARDLTGIDDNATTTPVDAYGNGNTQLAD
ncbi:hypothetical protein POSPLADRAFT_1056281 [Postia placenta MAD-698-R-SB12]|uniref:Uncharacterized protein n=1 Tax=Postia placenta MAD-698-R-SB12 TaxID=670580 RepID=A0A1X6N2U6_9APHY|nr:hypothetical protein POSPLADRAFT_1056281 [Postia placenta MAD-698-R-SB12]OSX62914.1 hypothetical protein POSPLADRAFT_1056281 [Postia placenta MAD-698-R-SB12]